MTPTRALRRLIERLGYFTTPATSASDVAALLQQLRPFETNHPLIRIGGAADGGYLIPDDLGGIQYCFSPGVSTVATFEEALLARGIKSFLADYSVNAPPPALKDFVFDKRFLGASDNETHFTLTHWIDKYLPKHGEDLILQMDIEGSEYPVLLETPEKTFARFRIIVIEFHFVEQLLNASLFRVLREAFQKLLSDFTVVHIHPNNIRGCSRRGSLYIPNVLEMTFLRNDRIATKHPATRFPHPLDQPNIQSRDDIILPTCWHS